MSVFAEPPNREPMKGMLGMDRMVRLVVAWGRRWMVDGFRKGDINVVVMFVRVNVRMRVGKDGKRMQCDCYYIK